MVDIAPDRCRRAAAIASGGVALMSVVGCSGGIASNTDQSATASTSAAPVSAEVSTRVADYLPSYGMISADAMPYASVAEMAADADLGATGTIASFSWGRFDRQSGDAADGIDFEPIIMKLDHTEVLSGALPDDFDGSLYVALPGFGTLEGHEATLPVGTRVTFYGIDLERPGMTLLEGAPEGQNVFNLIHPASLAVELGAIDAASRSAVAGETVVVFPLAGAVVADAQLEDVEPGDQLPDLDALAAAQAG